MKNIGFIIDKALFILKEICYNDHSLRNHTLYLITKGGIYIERVQTISVEETAKILNVFPQFIRRGLQQGRFPFGVAVKKEKSKHWNYLIIKSKLEQFVENETDYTKETN